MAGTERILPLQGEAILVIPGKVGPQFVKTLDNQSGFPLVGKQAGFFRLIWE